MRKRATMGVRDFTIRKSTMGDGVRVHHERKRRGKRWGEI